ncbi:hypothetical protein EDM68_00875 [Candidatus Uhrbacteria bacterium]|nr:MAG: hypothetical protein EDM68_00875 [Candidatus Uhrbacteria bacterium]
MSNKGSHVPDIGGYSLGDAISGAAPTGVSEDRPEPPPARCRWPGCRTILSVTNRPTDGKRSLHTPDIPEDPDIPQTPVAPRRSEEPDDEALCRMHRRATLDWHQGLSEDRPAHYPPEDPARNPVRKKKT